MENLENIQIIIGSELGNTNEALLEEVKSGLRLSLEYATDKSCSRPNKSKQTTDAAKGRMVQLR